MTEERPDYITGPVTPVEEKTVTFYEDDIPVAVAEDGRVFVPLRSMCDFLGVGYSTQRRRVAADPILEEQVRNVVITTAGGPQAMACLDLDYLNGWLFSISANRVKEEIRAKVLAYQRDCYRVLRQAFQDGRLTGELDRLISADTPAARAYQIAEAVRQMALQQLLLESRVDDHEQRLERVEAALNAPERAITEAQASQLSQAVKAVALAFSKQSGRNEYGGVYGELYRRFDITGYKLLPASRFQEAMDWLSEWHGQLTGEAF